MIYLDTSAAMKLVHPEPNSRALAAWLEDRRSVTTLSSVLIEVELLRATRRSAPERLDRAIEVLRGIGTVALSQDVIDRAAAYRDPTLRSLDSIHLATADHVRSLASQPFDAFVAYDERLLAAAQEIGLPVASPGTTPA